MARSTYKITVLLLWVVSVREVLTRDQNLPDSAAPELQGMIFGFQNNEESENDAIEMGRNAAEEMGALMASPPVKMFRLPQVTNNEQDKSRYESGSSANARGADVSPRPQCNPYNDALQWYPNSEPSGRSASPRTIPLTPLPPLPLIPGLSPVPFLSPLIQSLTNPGRLGLGFGARPLLRTPLPYVPTLQTPVPYMPALRTPSLYTQPALRTSMPSYIPQVNTVWPSPSPLRARSSFTPNKYARSANQYKPLVFYV